MVDGKHEKRTWQEIAKEIVDEQDSQKLLKLTNELTEAVDGELAKPVSRALKPERADHTSDDNDAFEQNNQQSPKTGTDGD